MSNGPSDTIISSLSILVVDDDELNQRMMRLLLKRDGHLVECVSNGLEALNAVKSQSFDIILMDLQMPVMDGVEASRRIREWENGGQPVFIVALTASFLPEKGAELFEAGIDNYIAKPFDMGHLRHILQYGLENRKLREASGEEHPAIALAPEDQEFDYQIGIQRVGGDRETYKELLTDFIKELPGKLEIMKTCFKEKDKEGLYRVAHNLKGVSANLGALQLSEHARRLEKQVGEGYTDGVESSLNDISTTAEKLIESAARFLADE